TAARSCSRTPRPHRVPPAARPPVRRRHRRRSARTSSGRPRQPPPQEARTSASERNKRMSPDPRGPALTGPRSFVGRVIGALLTLAALVVGLMFSVVLFGVALVLGLLVWGWLWWKMRRVLRQA